MYINEYLIIETGSVYTVWGKKSCPAVNGTTTVYTGNENIEKS